MNLNITEAEADQVEAFRTALMLMHTQFGINATNAFILLKETIPQKWYNPDLETFCKIHIRIFGFNPLNGFIEDPWETFP
jgi:hypothetical protein